MRKSIKLQVATTYLAKCLETIGINLNRAIIDDDQTTRLRSDSTQC